MSAAELDQAHARAAEHRARQRAKGAAREAAQATSVIASPEPAPARALSPREREIAEDRGQIVWLDEPLVVGGFKITGWDPEMVPAEWLRAHIEAAA
jgi:hypothetical protein